jgi:dehydrogenase/reductase SDR family member 7B
MNLKNKRIWITGASSGIGEALTMQLSGVAALLIISGRNEAALKSLAAKAANEYTRIEVLPFDLSNPEEVREAALSVISRFNEVDVLINSGGISQRSLFTESSIQLDRRIMEVNFFSQVLLTQLMVPGMVKQGSGHIVVTSSMVGKFGFPLRSAYAASKHALHGYFETIGLELHHKGIRTTVVCPGRIRTNISVNALTGSGNQYGTMDPGQDNGMSAERCAALYIKAIERNRWEAYIGRSEILMIWFKRYIPALFRKIAMKVRPQ